MQKFSLEMKNGWEVFAKTYINTMEKQTFSFYVMLTNMMKIDQAKNIIEVAGGSGFALQYAKMIIQPDCKYTMCDFSENMMKMAFYRLCQLANIEKELPDSFNSLIEFPELNISIMEADNMDLSYFANESFDRYISVLSMMLVEDPQKQIKEAFRVTKKGGLVGFTVAGRKENATLLSTYPRIIQEMGIPLPEMRSLFHLEDKDKMVNMLKENGFINIKAWYSVNPMNQEDEVLEFYENQPMAKKLRGFLNETQIKELNERIMKHVQKMKEENKVFQFENLMIVAEKP